MREWHGEGAFFDGQTSRRERVAIMINAGGVAIRREGSEDFLPLGEFRVAQRGEDGYLRLKTERFAAGEIILHNREAEAALETNGFLRSQVLSAMPKKTKLVLLASALALLLAFLFTYGIDAIIDRGLVLVSAETEAKLGRAVFDELLGSRPEAADDTTRRVLEKCAAVIQAFDTTGRWKIVIAVVEDKKTRNAFALPGGYIVIYRGILEIMQNESELFGLLAHEAGHIYSRHGLRRIARTAIIGFVASVLLGDAGGISAILLDNSALLLNLAYDRQEEHAADEYAVVALGKAGMDPRGLATLFEKIKKEEGDSRWLTFLATHPATEDRIAFLQQAARSPASEEAILTAGEWETLTGKR